MVARCVHWKCTVHFFYPSAKWFMELSMSNRWSNALWTWQLPHSLQTVRVPGSYDKIPWHLYSVTLELISYSTLIFCLPVAELQVRVAQLIPKSRTFLLLEFAQRLKISWSYGIPPGSVITVNWQDDQKTLSLNNFFHNVSLFLDWKPMHKKIS